MQTRKIKLIRKHYIEQNCNPAIDDDLSISRSAVRSHNIIQEADTSYWIIDLLLYSTGINYLDLILYRRGRYIPHRGVHPLPLILTQQDEI